MARHRFLEGVWSSKPTDAVQRIASGLFHSWKRRHRGLWSEPARNLQADRVVDLENAVLAMIKTQAFPKGWWMAHRFRIGDLVSFKAVGQKPALYKVVRQMPEEFPAIDWKYRIKSDQEDFQRTVLECDLGPSIIPEQAYEPLKPLRRAGRYH